MTLCFAQLKKKLSLFSSHPFSSLSLSSLFLSLSPASLWQQCFVYFLCWQCTYCMCCSVNIFLLPSSIHPSTPPILPLSPISLSLLSYKGSKQTPPPLSPPSPSLSRSFTHTHSISLFHALSLPLSLSVSFCCGDVECLSVSLFVPPA